MEPALPHRSRSKAAPKTTRYRAVRADSSRVPCPGCRTPLPREATFCIECGLCMLDVTSGGTVIARAPTQPSPVVEPGTPVPTEEVDTVELELDDVIVEEPGPRPPPPPAAGELLVGHPPAPNDESFDESCDESFDIDFEDDEIDAFFDDPPAPSTTLVTRSVGGPQASVSRCARSSDGRLWPAPARGQTVVGPRPAAPSEPGDPHTPV